MRISALLLLVAMTTACGFQLRGTGDGAFYIPSVQVAANDPYGDLNRTVKRAFRDAGTNLAASSDAEVPMVKLLGEQVARRVVSTSRNLTASDYELTLEIAFEVFNGDDMLRQQTLQTTRIYAFNANNLTGNTAEERLLLEEMREELAGQIVRIAGAVARNAAGQGA